MRIDRILADILQWVGQVVWWREDKVKPRPYEKIKTWRLDKRGQLHKVIRPQSLCPRDVGSYIFEPYRYGRNTKDLHICCDHLEGMSKPKSCRDKSRVIHTHRLTVLLADHWVGPDGCYAAKKIFTLDDDWQGNSSRRDLHINCLLHAIAMAIAAAPDWDAFDYLREVDNAKKYCMRGGYTHTLNLPRPTGVAIAQPVDGGKAVRVKFD